MRAKIKFYPWIISILILFLTAVPIHAKGDIEKTPESNAKVIKFAYPIQAGISEKDEAGNYSGYTYDYLQEIAQYTGWEYEFIEVPGDINESLAAMMDMLEKGEVDLMGALAKNEQTQQLFDFPEYGYGYSYTNMAALEENARINETNLQNVKELRIVAYMNLYSAEYMSNYSKYQNLRFIPQTDKTIDYCIGIKKPVDSTLVSLINKVLINIEAADMETIIYQNTAGGYEKVTLASFIKHNPFISIGIVSAVFLILAVIGLSVLRYSMKTGRRLKIQHERFLRLSELANEYIYEYDYDNDVLICSKEFAKLFALPDKVYQFSEELKNNLFLASINPTIGDRFEKEEAQEKIIETERYCLLPDNSRRWFRNSNAAIRDEAGKKMYIIGKLTDIQNEKEERERLEMQGQTDGLTGLLNAASTKEMIKERIENLSRTGALLIIDIDKFKNVNDWLGHLVGDKVLSEFAKTLSGEAGKYDTVGRIGGDEFMIFVDTVQNIDQAASFCQRICEKARRTYRNEEGSSLSVTTSIGAVLLEQSCGFEEAFKCADKLLYESKRKGRDCYTIKKCRL